MSVSGVFAEVCGRVDHRPDAERAGLLQLVGRSFD